MEIICNGKKRTAPEGTTVHGFIVDLGFEPDLVVAEFDGRILERQEYETILLHEGSVLEIIRFVGGG